MVKLGPQQAGHLVIIPWNTNDQLSGKILISYSNETQDKSYAEKQL